MTSARLNSWEDVAAFLHQQPPETRICIHKGFLPHPQVFLMASVIYPPQGQLATYYKRLSPTAGLLVRDFGTYYDAQIDVRYHVEEVSMTPPTDSQKLIASGTALGAVLGSALGRSSKSVAAAALLGGAIAALLSEGRNK